MSYHATRWAVRLPLRSFTAYRIVQSLAEHTDKCGVTTVSQEAVADEVGTTRRRVTRYQNALERAGVIQRFPRRRVTDGHKLSNWVVLAPNWADRGDMADADAKLPPKVAAAAKRGLRVPLEGAPRGLRVPLRGHMGYPPTCPLQHPLRAPLGGT